MLDTCHIRCHEKNMKGFRLLHVYIENQVINIYRKPKPMSASFPFAQHSWDNSNNNISLNLYDPCLTPTYSPRTRISTPNLKPYTLKPVSGLEPYTQT